MPSLLKQVEDEFLRLLNARIGSMRSAIVAMQDGTVEADQGQIDKAHANYGGLMLAKGLFESAVEDTRTRQHGSRHKKLLTHLSTIKSVVNKDPKACPEHAVASALLFVLEEMQ